MPSPTHETRAGDTREQVLDRAHFLATGDTTGTTYHCVGVPLLTGSTPRGIAQRHMTIALPSLEGSDELDADGESADEQS